MAEATKAADGRTKPQLGGSQQEQTFERVDDFEIEIDAPPHLEEGKNITGKISECYGLRSDNGEIRIKLAIAISGGGEYESLNSLKYSPLKRLISDVEVELGRRVKPEDLLGMWVSFSVKYNKGYWNLKTIARTDAPEDEDDDYDWANDLDEESE
jgi:hypothetical protein